MQTNRTRGVLAVLLAAAGTLVVFAALAIHFDRGRDPALAFTSEPLIPPSPTRVQSEVTGTYRVMDSYDDAFIGEVLVANEDSAPHDRVVELRFPATVGTLVTSWVESAPQATLTEGETYRWTSGVPVEGNARVAPRFHFQRRDGGDLPRSCTVNGTPCSIPPA